ncbi:putative alpha/beta-glucosidase agdC [Talaromyces atroroseus]|uniref:Probable alpha/beta-glucosidase agdC n=1 Tax=Talaromyces atroroseus TaxID=1441469 RepID=A0A225AN68_TALAT|nr:putative alpha/beta-glucosidase agdC [Talaromyces atroroseus]OKL62330.1 putative alpha/beta-glucosidase agdC [Talaromyces atroroseus]
MVQTDASLTADLSLAGDACNAYGQDIDDLKLLVEYQTDSRLHVKIYDAQEEVYQIPKSILDPPTGAQGSSRDSDLIFSYTESPFSFAIQRSSSKETLFNTSGSNLIFESQYVRLRTSLPEDPNLYGLGENSDPFRLETVDYTRTLWNAGQAFLPQYTNLYSSHPIYLEMRNGQAHGVFLSNSNGMDIKINRTKEAGQYLEYNIIGGVLDFYFLSGPAPADVARQYAGVVGTPTQQSYWTYGFHQCKYGYRDVMWVADVVYNYSQASIPLETMWTDIDYMNLRRTWTLDPERFPLDMMQELVTYLHDHGQQYIVMVDPPISLNDSKSYDTAVDSGALLKYDNGTYFVATMWPGAVSYIDWFHPNAQSFWSGQIGSFFNDESGIDVDGMWIDMNEPANFCGYPCTNPVEIAIEEDDPPAPPPVRTTWPPIPGFPADFQPPTATSSPNSQKVKVKRDNSPSATGNMTGLPGRNFDNPPYAIDNGVGPLSVGTIWPELQEYGGYVQYDTHNLYASAMIAMSREGLLERRPKQRPFIISRSTFSGDGRNSGHWTGDNASTWAHYLLSIVQNMEFASIFQIPMVGADVCGFNDNTTETLCARWAMLGAWYPFYRNHADISANSQEFYRWPLVTAAAQKAITARFSLLDYFYTAFYQQTVDGSPKTIMPLFFEYPNDPKTLNISYQFFFGPSVLVSPVTVEDSLSVTLYLPPEDIFYDFWTGESVTTTDSSDMLTLDNVTYTDIPAHIRGGTILPLRSDAKSANTTAELRTHDFELLIAPDANGKASGSLYLDDGITLDPQQFSNIEFSYENGHLVVNGSFGYDSGVQVKSLTVLVNGAASTSNSSSSTDSYGRNGIIQQLNQGLDAGWEADI